MSETDTAEAAVEDMPLLGLLGESARVRIIQAFVANRERELNVSEVAREAGIARSTVYDHLDDLLALGVLEERGKRYTLAETDLAQGLYEAEGLTLQRQLANRDDIDV